MNSKPKAVILDAGTLGSDISLDVFRELPVDIEFFDTTSPEQVLERVKGAMAVFTNKVVMSRETIEQCPELQYIGVLATGTNNIDHAACKDHNVRVRNVERYSTTSVAQQAMAFILALAGRLTANHENSVNGLWQNSKAFCLLDNTMMELAGRKMLIIGYGDLGKATAKLAEAFGMEILKARIPGSSSNSDDRIDLDEGLAIADVVSLHCPLIETTKNLIDERRLSLMQSHALLINTGRGGLVDEQALAEALKAGTIAGAGFDVLTQEPPVNGNPLLGPSIPNLLVSPHIAWASLESRQKLIKLTIQFFREFLEG